MIVTSIADSVIVLCFAVRYIKHLYLRRLSAANMALAAVGSCITLCAIISMGKIELVAKCFVFLVSGVVRLFLMIPPVCLQFAFVVFPDHTHLLFM